MARRAAVRAPAAVDARCLAEDFARWRNDTGHGDVADLAGLIRVVRSEEAQATLLDPDGARARIAGVGVVTGMAGNGSHLPAAGFPAGSGTRVTLAGCSALVGRHDPAFWRKRSVLWWWFCSCGMESPHLYRTPTGAQLAYGCHLVAVERLRGQR